MVRIIPGMLFIVFALTAATQPIKPANPDLSPEARRLLSYIYEISGEFTLSGQHNYPGTISESTEKAHEITGVHPAVWGQDFGFTADDKDGIVYRQAVMDEAVRQHELGSIITLMWHAVRPVDDEPNGWKESVQNDLTDDEWNELVTSGSPLNQRWLKQLDVVAGYLAQLRDKNVPVLWRPYHEMNGGWFWWGHKEGEQGYAALWKMMFDRFVNEHKLDNLIWVWNPNAPRGNAGPYADYYPGHDYVDILAADVYNNDYKQSHHDDLLALADGRPIAIGECGVMPTPEILDSQPRWAWFMTWTNFLYRKNEPEAVKRLYDDPRVLARDEVKIP